MDLHLKDKVVAVTGGTAGLGKAIALEFAKEGCKLAICSRTSERLDAACAELEKAGCDFYSQLVDVSDVSAIASFIKNVSGHFGHIDIWVNNAATNLSKHMVEITPDEWDHVFDTNLKGYFFGAQLAIKDMIEKSVKGVIVNVSSYASTLPVLTQSLYAASKIAINSLTRSFAADSACHGIRVVAVTPGWIKTERAYQSLQETKADMKLILSEISQQRMGEPEEIARPIVFLASDASSYITGTCLEISGGKFTVQRPWDGWPEK
ncbi:beta-ketoacyl-ACP reductase [Synergistales bacterium]|nr:beta-ketoacyl-ACP reductase [Synergistales bacterium]